MKIILAHGYFLSEDLAEQKIMMPYPPQGLLHLHAYLSTHGISSSIFDSTFASFDEMISHLNAEKPDVIGLYCNLMTRINIVKIIQFIRNDSELKNMKIILGGPDVKHHRQDYLAAGADIRRTYDISRFNLAVVDVGGGRGVGFHIQAKRECDFFH